MNHLGVIVSFVLVGLPASAREAPSARHHHAMAYDAARGRLVLFGGNGDEVRFFSDTWEWDGEVWSTRPSGPVEGRSSFAMLFEPSSSRTLLFGGVNAESLSENKTWAWDGETWTVLADQGPSARYSPAIAYDEARKGIVLFSGSGRGTDQMWEWSQQGWQQISLSGERPAPRARAQMAFDPVRKTVILFGGFDGGKSLGDTWEWDGTARNPETWRPWLSTANRLAWSSMAGGARIGRHWGTSGYGTAAIGGRSSSRVPRPRVFEGNPMQSIDLIRDNLKKSADRVLLRIEDMRDHCMVYPTPKGGAHTLWVLGHLAYIEALVIREFMLAEPSPLAEWQEIFDGAEISEDVSQYPPFDQVLAKCREIRESTLALLDSLTEEDLDKVSAKTPEGFEDTFGTYRLCLQLVADHWYMHRGQLADARRAAGLERMWL